MRKTNQWGVAWKGGDATRLIAITSHWVGRKRSLHTKHFMDSAICFI